MSPWRAAAALLLALLPVAAPAQEPDPARTFVFVAGLLEWKDAASFAPFPKENRRDHLLVEHFRRRGVPESQIVALHDAQATTAAVTRRLSALLARTRPGDSLVVYFCGHGYKDEAGETWLATWDAGAGNPGWKASSIPDQVDREFKGSRAILAADCCHSGELARAVRGRRRVSYAAFGSSLASESSTANWTFTEALLDGLQGRPWVDQDGDGAVELGELAATIRADMAFAEEQLAASAFTGDYGPDTVLVPVSAPSVAGVGRRVLVESGGETWKGRVVAQRNGRYRVHYFGWDASDDEWMASSALRDPPPARTWPTGARVLVSWKKTWYPARVLASRDGIHQVHYDGYGPEWDEWVGSERVRAVR